MRVIGPVFICPKRMFPVNLNHKRSNNTRKKFPGKWSKSHHALQLYYQSPMLGNKKASILKKTSTGPQWRTISSQQCRV